MKEYRNMSRDFRMKCCYRIKWQVVQSQQSVNNNSNSRESPQEEGLDQDQGQE